MTPTEPEASTEPKPQRAWKQRLVMLAVVLTVVGVGRFTGLHELVSLESIRATVTDAGPLAVPLYLGVFVGAVTLGLPGGVFVVAGLVAFGVWQGTLWATVGAAVGGTLATWLYGKVGGTPVGVPAHPIARRVQARLGARPLLTIAVVRFLMRLAPPSHMALALAGVSPRDNLLGTLLGMAPKVFIASLFLDWIVAQLS